jgi:hypothetical protein
MLGIYARRGTVALAIAIALSAGSLAPQEAAEAVAEPKTATVAQLYAGCTTTQCPLGVEWETAKWQGGVSGYCWWQAACGNNCTNYVAWRLSRAGVANFVIPSVSAHGWNDRAVSAGFVVNHTPAVNAIAHWESGNHVAIVEAISGTNIVVSEDSAGGLLRWTTKSQTSPDWYIHVPGFTNGGLSSAAVVAPGDWDGDGLNDVLHIRAAGLYLYKGNGAGGFINPSGGTLVGMSWHTFKKVLAPGDWDGDGFVDLLAIANNGALYLYRGNGAGGFAQSGITIGSSWHAFKDVIAPGDYTGDGTPDLMAVATDGTLYLYPGNGTGGFLSSSTVGAGWSGFAKLVTPGDWSGDGNVDVLGAMPNGDMYRYTGNGAGGWATTGVLIGTSWTFREVVGSPDFSGNGTSDVFAVTTGGALYFYNGNGTGGFGSSGVQIGSDW